ncbi:hypothetical protein H7X46_07770 [Pseudonocardia sp. C8]|nr:hypothetical protein [Pseudonocardia sp. C8]
MQVHDQPEGVGSRRTVEAKLGRKQGTFTERRIIHDETARVMAFVIEADTFGLGKLLAHTGSLMRLEPLDNGRTRLTWSFFHEPRNAVARLMNRLMILRQQRRNRLRALESFKSYAETGAARRPPAELGPVEAAPAGTTMDEPSPAWEDRTAPHANHSGPQ